MPCRKTYDQSVDADELLKEHEANGHLGPLVYRHFPTVNIKADLQFNAVPMAWLCKTRMFFRRQFITVGNFGSDFVPFLLDALIIRRRSADGGTARRQSVSGAHPHRALRGQRVTLSVRRRNAALREGRVPLRVMPRR